MSYYVLFYWLTIVSNLISTSVIMGALAITLFIIGLIAKSDQYDPDAIAMWTNIQKKCKVVLIVSSIVYVFVPNKKDTLLIIAGGAVGNFITQDSSAQKIPSDITNFLHTQLQELTKEAADELTGKKPEDMTKEELLELVKKNQ